MRTIVGILLLLAGLHQPLLAQPEIAFRSFPGNQPLCHMSIPPLTSRTWQIVALPNGLGGIQGAEFHVAGMPATYTHVVTPNPAAFATLGKPSRGGLQHRVLHLSKRDRGGSVHHRNLQSRQW